MAHDPQSDGGPANAVLDEREGRYLLAAARLNIELSLIGSQQTLSEADHASFDRHAFSRDVRRLTTRKRQQTATDRMNAARHRDAVAQVGDLAGRARDVAAEARDRAMAALDRLTVQEDSVRAVTATEMVTPDGALRPRAARYREKSAQYRAQAVADRQAAAHDRAVAARDRLAATADRERLLRELSEAETDALTKTRTRKAGHEDLQREIDRCHRTNVALTIAYVDVVGLKARNDSRGHAAGDQLLIDVVACIRAHLRTYDHITRVGGDEFVCAMPNMTIASAQTRFSLIASVLAGGPDASAIRVGYAQLACADSTADLIARADDDLTASRRDEPSSRRNDAPPATMAPQRAALTQHRP
jgi:diguanylate cyclase (GGDEF)-like protein